MKKKILGKNFEAGEIFGSHFETSTLKPKFNINMMLKIGERFNIKIVVVKVK